MISESMYIDTPCVRYSIIGHMTVEAGNVVGTDGTPPQVPPQTLRRQAQRLSRFGGRAVRSGRPDADEEDEVLGGIFERCGRTLQTAPVSTMNCCLHSSSCKKIMPPPRVFSSRRLLRFPGSTGTRACTSWCPYVVW